MSIDTLGIILHVQKRLAVLSTAISVQVIFGKEGFYSIVADMPVEANRTLRATASMHATQLKQAVVPEIILDDTCLRLVSSLLTTLWSLQDEQG